MAHELGHYALGHGTRPRDLPTMFSSRQTDPIERDANKFAAALLMPASAIKYLVSQMGVTDISDLASTFDVSEVAMEYRLKNLGYL